MSSKTKKKKKAVFTNSLYENLIDARKCGIGDNKIESWILNLCASEKKSLSRKEFVLLVAAICPVVTRRLYQAVLSYPVSNNSYISAILRELVTEGMLVETVLDKEKYYKITGRGFDCINKVINEADEVETVSEPGAGLSLDIQTPYKHHTDTIMNRKEGILAGSRKKRVRKKFTTPFHSSGISQVLCQMLRSGLMFEYMLETEMKEGPLIHLMESVKTDMVVKVDSNCLYIEQDTGTETIGVLADKVFRYCNADSSFDAKEVYSRQMLFSFERKYVERKGNVSHNSILTSKSELLKFGYDSDMSLQELLRALGGEYRGLRDAVEEFIEKSNQVAVYDQKEAKNYALADYYDYVDAIRDGTSRIEKVYRNCSEYNFAKKRFLHLAHSYCEATENIENIDGDGAYRGVDVLNILKGLNVYGIPTYRIIDALPLLFPYKYDTFSLLRKSLRNLSTFMQGEANEDACEKMHFSNSYRLPEYFWGQKRHLPVRFNNVLYYEYDKDDPVYNVYTIVEYISGNIAGYVRMYYLLKHIDYQDTNIRCIGIVDSEDEAREFLDYLDLDEKIERDAPFSQDSFRMYFVKTCDLGTEKFFSVARDGEIRSIDMVLEF